MVSRGEAEFEFDRQMPEHKGKPYPKIHNAYVRAMNDFESRPICAGADDLAGYVDDDVCPELW